MFPEVHRLALLALARGTLEAHVRGQSMPALELSDALARSAGAFVSLHKRGQLRGCIGHIEADQPLPRVIARCAAAAASSDPRFSPVAEHELADIRIELSILGPLESVGCLDDVEIGRHGLVVEQGFSRGLLLPQVAVEWKWDLETFAAETCRKAGLPPHAWTRGATLWRFEAEVFAEPDHRRRR